MTLVDSHCHLDFPDFNGELPEILARARAAGVTRMVTICTRLRNEPTVRAIAEANDGVFYAAGTHPMSAAEEPLATVEQLVALAKHPKFVGLGETGLDYHYTASTAAIQQTSLRIHIEAAQETQLPLIIHARDADDDVAKILAEGMKIRPYPCVMHCFSSGPGLAQAALEMGFYLSMSGIPTFPKSGALRDIFAAAPPVPHPDRDRQPLPRPRPASRQTQRTGLHRLHRENWCANLRHHRGRICRRHLRQFRPPVHQGRPNRESCLMATLRFTILGCGSSGGVPRLGNDWGDCDPQNPKNRRRRCSMLVERISGDQVTKVLIDTSPDMREQLLDANVGTLDGVVFTHSHADHTHGIDDLRQVVFNMKRRLPIWADSPTQAALISRFAYAFVQPEGSPYPPILDLHSIDGTFHVDGPAGPITFQPFLVDHGSMDALGFRIGPLAYLPDVVRMPENVWPVLEGLECWVLDALRRKPHPTHIHLALALDWIARVKPATAVITNMHLDMDYETLVHELPPTVSPAFDSRVITFENQP